MTASRTVGDDLLRWASEVGSGDWEQLSEAAAQRSSRSGTPPRKAWIIASELAALAHIDIDWATRQWSVAPPCLALSPGMGLCAYLAGWRTESLDRRLQDALEEDLGLYSFSIAQGEATSATFVKAASPERLADLADQLHIRMVYDPARHLADLVQVDSTNALPLCAGPPNDEPVERFDDVTFGWKPVSKPFGPGLHSFDLHGMKVFRVLDDRGDWHAADRAAGQLAVLNGREGVLSWHRQSQDARHPRALSVPGRISLPALAERAATTASGLLPLFRSGHRIFLNVDRDVASTLAHALGIVLTRTHEIDL